MNIFVQQAECLTNSLFSKVSLAHRQVFFIDRILQERMSKDIVSFLRVLQTPRLFLRMAV
jgi:hypothetical protein